MLARCCRALLGACLLSPLAPAQQSWTAVATPVTQTLWGVTAAGGRFVAVGEGGAIVVSDDAIRWTTAVSGTTRWLLDVTRPPDRNPYVAVGEGGTILTSSDGTFWTPQSSGTTQRLNSVIWGGDRFLAVGEGGTALTSPDGLAWTPRRTGDTGWLRGLAYGHGRFVVTGHDGTVLVSTDGGVTFQPGLNPSVAHLDAAIFTGDRFHVTGSDLVLGSSVDGLVWTIDSSLNANGSETGIVYNGLAYFNQTLLAVGDRGRIRDQHGGAWNSSAITTDWRAVTASRSVVLAVGTGGGAAYSRIGGAGYHIRIAGVPYVGRRVELHADLVGQPATPFNSQWARNGRPIPGATRASLVLDPAALADSGNYSFTSSVTNGTLLGTYQLSVYAGPASVGLIDPTFNPVLNAGVDALLPLPDGRLYVAGRGLSFPRDGRTQSGLARLHADGSIDPAFDAGAGLGLGLNTPVLFLQSTGRLVVWAQYTRTGGIYATPLARYLPDGSRDASFTPDSGLRDTTDLPILLQDDRWLTATPQTSAAGNRELALARYTPNGTADPAFVPQLATAPFATPSNQARTSVISTVDAQGRVYLGLSYGLASTVNFAASSPRTALLRLNADGTPDTTFAQRSFDALHFLHAAPQGILIKEVAWSWSRPSYRRWTESTRRLRFDGTEDPTFHPIVTELGPSLEPSVASFGPPAVLADGSLILPSRARLARRGFVRFDATGSFDPEFSAELDDDTARALISQRVPLPSGQLLLAGSFATFQGEPRPYLVRLAPDYRNGATHLTNLSVRSPVDPASDAGPLIVGFVIAGGEANLLARAAGPALAPFGVPNPLADPQLELYAGPTPIGGNDDWGTGPVELLAATATRLGAFPFSAASRDAALYTPAPAGTYTVQVSGAGSVGGVTLAEVYDATAPPTGFSSPRVTNFSVRTPAGAGDATLIAGFAVGGRSSRNFLVRAAGPSLAGYGVPGFLRDPVLTIYRGDAAIAQNDNWGQAWYAGDGPVHGMVLAEATRIAGAFAFPLGSRDAALAISLPPGLYTARVTSADTTAGVVLVEVYEVP